MPPLNSQILNLPAQLTTGVFEKAKYGSIVGNLVQSDPMKFGEVQYMTFTERPRAEFIDEGAEKAPSNANLANVKAKPHKAQVTIRVNQEVQWADEDYQLGIMKLLADSCGEALARALDLGVFHGINPLTGAPASSIADKIADTTLIVTSAGKLDKEIEAAAKLVLAKHYVPNGVALDPAVAYDLATMRDTTGRKLYPEIGLTTKPTNYDGLAVSVSTTVSGVPEIAAPSKLVGIVGNWEALKWGVQKNIPIEKIVYGDPDGQGDLKRQNQIALRAEIVYGWGILDIDSFALIKTV